MTKQRVVLTLALCSLVAFLSVQALSQARSSSRGSRASDVERSRGKTGDERKKEAEEKRRQRELREKELAKEGRGRSISIEQRQKNMRNKTAERRREFLDQKSALGASEEQWKLIKAKLEKVRLLRGQANSTVGLFLAGGSSDNKTNLRTRAKSEVPTWQWKQPWKDKAPEELTEAQKLAKQLIALVENNNTTAEQFRRKMDALRKARSEEAEIESQLSGVRKELREMLTIRQEAALILMKWL
jgi:hypothetical protein